jgi:hypothetical protein
LERRNIAVAPTVIVALAAAIVVVAVRLALSRVFTGALGAIPCSMDGPVGFVRPALTFATVAVIAVATVVPAAQAAISSSGAEVASVAVGPAARGLAPDPPTTANGAEDSTTTTLSDSTSTTEPQPTTTTTAAPVAPPQSTTTTPPATTAARPSVPSTTPSTARSAASGSPSQIQQAESIADESRWNWRGAGVVIHVRFHPEACCHWGIYDPRDNSLWIGPTAFANTTRLRYVVLHELGHAWQWNSGHLDQLAADMTPWGHSGNDGLEAGADCISVVWGASAKAGHYWTCPSNAAALVARRLAGDWR